MCESSMRTLVKIDLKMKSLATQKVQMMAPQQRKKRIVCGKKIETFLKCGLNGKVFVFSDETDSHQRIRHLLNDGSCHVDHLLNRRND